MLHMSPLLCFSCLPARIWMLLIMEGTFITQLKLTFHLYIYFWIVQMVTRVIYMHFASSTSSKIIPADGNVMTWTFVTFDIRLLYLLSVYLYDLGRTIINWEVMALLSMTRLVSFNKWEGGSLLSEWLEEAERVVEEFRWEKTHSSGLNIGRYEGLTREENELDQWIVPRQQVHPAVS